MTSVDQPLSRGWPTPAAPGVCLSMSTPPQHVMRLCLCPPCLQRKLLLQELAPAGLEAKFSAAHLIAQQHVERWCAQGGFTLMDQVRQRPPPSPPRMAAATMARGCSQLQADSHMVACVCPLAAGTSS